MKIYVASSWRNTLQPEACDRLWQDGHEPYDFRNPAPGNQGFHWRDTADNANWQKWSNHQFVKALSHPIAERGFEFDFNAMKDCDACLLLLPCGRSAHLEAGWFIGAGKPCVVCLDDRIGGEQCVPELMYKMATHVAIGLAEASRVLATIQDVVEDNNRATYPSDEFRRKLLGLPAKIDI